MIKKVQISQNGSKAGRGERQRESESTTHPAELAALAEKLPSQEVLLFPLEIERYALVVLHAGLGAWRQQTCTQFNLLIFRPGAVFIPLFKRDQSVLRPHR